jgi:DNA-binding NtrC family response regulator
MQETIKMTDRASVLIIDDEPIAIDNLSHVFRRSGYTVERAESGEAAIELLDHHRFDVVLTDLRMPGIDGLTLLKHIRAAQTMTEVIVVTAYASPHSAVEAMHEGAFYYVEKPFRLEDVRKVVAEAVEKVRLKKENASLRSQVANDAARNDFLSEDPEMLAIIETATRVAPSDCSVLIEGETGTGKELMARLLHRASLRKDFPFVAVNCGAFTEELLANELFGHQRGAFTGALNEKAGLFEAANEGTLFLDEVTEMPLPMQVKLLRVLQEKEVLRLGATKPVPVNVRILAATNRNAAHEVEAGRLRQDLYYRINVVTLSLPPLRQRPRDIPILAMYFLEHYSRTMARRIDRFSGPALDALQKYRYPGNIRELGNIIERGVAISRGDKIELDDLPRHVTGTDATFDPFQNDSILQLEELEARYITWVLDLCQGNQQLAARHLGIDRSTLWRKLKQKDAE